MQKKVNKIIRRIVLCVFSLFFLIVGATQFWYLPHYLINKRILRFDALNNQEIRVMSYNIRCYAPIDLGKKSWFYRANLIAKNIENIRPDIIGFQEVIGFQYNYLKEILSDYSSVIEYRDNFMFSEGCPVFYRKDSFELIDQGSFWLSETPDTMSKDWGSANNRVCSYIIIKDKLSGNELIVFNTHLDHKSEEARIKGIQVVRDMAAKFNDRASLLMGDFNASPNTVTYTSAMESFIDACVIVDSSTNEATFQNWGAEFDAPRIDYIMTSKTGIHVNTYKVVSDTFGSVYPSDHFPIYADIILTD